ncbi:hypothetical protein D1872_38390 [compost metagenome]
MTETNTQGTFVTAGNGSAAGELMNMQEASKLFGVVNKIKSTKGLISDIEQQQSDFVQASDEQLDHLNAFVNSKTMEELKNLSPEELDEVFTFNGQVIEFQLKLDTDVKKQVIREDYLILLKETGEAKRKLEESLEELDNIYKDSEVEIKQLIHQFGNMDNYIDAELQHKLDSMQTEEEKDRIRVMIEARRNATYLDNLIEHYQSFSVANTMNEYKRQSQGTRVFDKYLKNAKSLGITSDITRLTGIERHLPEKYAKYEDLFLFTVVKYIAYKKDLRKSIDGMFLHTLLTNISTLILKFDTNADEQTQQKSKDLKVAITRVLDIFIDQQI